MVEKWYNLSKASEELGFGSTYVSVWLRRHKNEIPDGLILQSGNSKLLSDEGIEWLKSHIKKGGVLANNSSVCEDKYLKLTVLGNTLLPFYRVGLGVV